MPENDKVSLIQMTSIKIDSLDINLLHFRAEILVDQTFAPVMQHQASLFLRLKIQVNH